MYVYMHVCLYVYMHIVAQSVYTCIYIYTHIWYTLGEPTFSYVVCILGRKVPLGLGQLSSILGHGTQYWKVKCWLLVGGGRG